MNSTAPDASSPSSVPLPTSRGPVLRDSTSWRTTEARVLLGLFVAALVAHFICARFNWHSGFLIGHEFRQTQTALIAHYIDEQNNFSLRYETPLFGKPWEAPLELPFYEWCVVWAKRATGWPVYEAARAVSLAFFYLLLPGLYVLLGQVGVPPPRRLLALTFAVCCPVYLFYSRAFLMESTVLFFAVWFLACFVQAMRTRRWRWVVLCGASGAMAGVIKSLTLLVWLTPAAAYGAWCVWNDWRNHDGLRPLGTTIAWGLACAIGPILAVTSWIRFTDSIKEVHPSAFIFTSANLSGGNFGMFSLAARFEGNMWRSLLTCWELAVMPPWWLAVAVAGGLALAGRMRWPAALAALLWLVAQLTLPYAYAFQDYYFYAATLFLMASLGLAAHGVLDGRLPRWLRWAWLAVPLGGLWSAYLAPEGYRAMQKYWSPGGTGLTDALRAVTPKNSVLVIAGMDWSAIIPYYSQRRALMIRNGLEHDPEYLDRAFHDLADEDVSALVLVGQLRGNRALLERAAQAFDLEREPTFQHPSADVYIRHVYREAALGLLVGHTNFDQVKTTATVAPRLVAGTAPREIPHNLADAAFSMIQPAPLRGVLPFGFGTWDIDGVRVLQAHSSTDLWLEPPAHAKEILWEFGVLESAYAREGEKTDGVDFLIAGESAAGRRELFARRLLPATTPGDRGTQRVVLPYTAQPGEVLTFLTRPAGAQNYDWAYIKRIDVR